MLSVPPSFSFLSSSLQFYPPPVLRCPHCSLKYNILVSARILIDILITRASLVRGKLEDALDGVDCENDGLSIEPGPGNVDLQLMNVTGHQTEGKMELLLQHVQSKVEVVEDGVATPERDLGVLSLNVLDISLHLAEDDGSYVGLEFEHSNVIKQ